MRRLFIITGLLLVIAVLVWLSMTVHWGMQQPKPHDFARLVRAMQHFTRDSAATGEAGPAIRTMTVPALIQSGYLPSTDARVFADMDITLTVTGDVHRVENILMRVRLPDGTVVSQNMAGAEPPTAP